MKKNVFIIILSMSVFFCEAQSLLGEYLKDVGYEGQQMSILTEAVMPSLSIIRQQFRLERGGQFYGKNNMPYYGETYSLGIKISGGEIYQKQVVFPWMNDDDYQRVNKTSKYKPVYFWSYQRALTDTLFRTVELELGTEYIRPLRNDSLLFIHDDAQSDFGLAVDNTSGEKSGFIVWVYASNMNDSTMQVSLKQSSMKVFAEKDSMISADPQRPNNTLGGIYVVPTIERVGIIRLKLVGVCTKTEDNKWVICLLTKDDDRKQSKKRVASLKARKESADGAEPTPIK